MKKVFLQILMLVLALFLVSCNGDSKKIPDDNGDNGNNNGDNNGDNGNNDVVLITLEEVLELIEDVKSEFLVVSELNILLETEVNEEVASLKASYEISGFNVNSFKYKSSIADEEYEAYVKNNIQYINFNGYKVQKSLPKELERKLISDYSFLSLTETFFLVHTEAYFNILKVLLDEEGIIKLSWDKEEFINAEFITLLKEELGLNADIDSIEVEIKHNEEGIIYIESIIKGGSEKVRFLLNFYADEFVYPIDLDGYLME